MKIAFEKYKRVFAFGCSFTEYSYPTWADIIAIEMPDAEIYNLAKRAGGNMLIAARIAEANLRFDFCDTDLVMVMYTMSFREDRHLNGSWKSVGNIYEQSYYPMDKFVLPYCQPVGMLIRDSAIIELSSQYVRSLPCDNLLLKAAPVFAGSAAAPNFQKEENKVTDLYKKMFNRFPPTLCETEFPDGLEPRLTFTPEKKLRLDYHPLPNRYRNYLLKIGINLTERSEKYVEEAMSKVNNAKVWKDLTEDFPEILQRREYKKSLMF